MVRCTEKHCAERRRKKQENSIYVKGIHWDSWLSASRVMGVVGIYASRGHGGGVYIEAINTAFGYLDPKE
jgi:hypothetical protein